MTREEKRSIAQMLFNQNREFFFSFLGYYRNQIPELKKKESHQIIIEHKESGGFYMLKEEFLSKLDTISQSEILLMQQQALVTEQIRTVTKQTRTVKNWVKFLGWYTIISIIIWIILFFWIDAQLSEFWAF